MKDVKAVLYTLAVLLCVVSTTVLARSEQGDPTILAMMHEINDQLEAYGFDFRLVQVELYTIGWGQPLNRILRNGARWVPDDERREAQGDNITYLVDKSNGATASGLTSSETGAAIDSAMTTWDSQRSLQKVDIVKQTDPGSDVTFFDGYFGYGFGYPFCADIVHAGWHPKSFFDMLEPNGGHYILAVSVTFIWVYTATGQPTDINGDNYLDTAFNEIYYNDNFGDPGGTRPGNPWGIDAALPGIDVETVALHESGHSLGLGHFGPPPEAVMNPVYSGICQVPHPVDNAGVSSLYRSWPNP